MDDTQTRSSTSLYIVAALAALFLTGGAYFWSKSRDLDRRADQFEQQADSLLSTKLHLEGDIRSLNAQLETTTDEKNYLDKRLTNLNGQLGQRDLLVRQLRRTDAGRSRAIGQLNQRIADLSTTRDSMTNQMTAVQDKISRLTSTNTQLTGQNQDLTRNVTDLQSTLSTMVPRSAMTGDAFRIEIVKNNKKETAKAKKVAALMVSLSVPAELGLTGNQEVFLSLTDEQRNSMLPPLRSATISLPGVNEVIPVHAEQTVNFALSPQRIAFRLDPSDKLKPGLYRASVFTKEAYLGTVEFHLRDSFLFF